MYKVYYLVSESTKWYYIGITKNSLKTRMSQHNSAARRGIKSPLYDCMRKYCDYEIVLRDKYKTHKECCDREVALIKEAKELHHKILNLADGGEGGFFVQDIESWKLRLKEKRRGKKPALGMRHTEENKKLFSEISKERWRKIKTYDAKEVCKLSFKDAKEKFNISKTHYYRLKRALLSE